MLSKTWATLIDFWTTCKNAVITHGIKIIFILICMLIALRLARFLGKKVSEYNDQRSDERTSQKERKKRADTLIHISVFACRVVIVVTALFMVLQELGLDIAPLLAGAGVVGLAIGFGAQNIVKDFFSGFFILLENQYRVGDVVKIGDMSGVVENVNLRTTVLRDLAGILHVIPNGEIKMVSNMTFGWSRAVVEIGVAFKENLDRVFQVLSDTGKELAQDEGFREKIIETPEVLGVERFDASAIIIKILIKTRPMEQWAVGREYRKRIKEAFDREGIVIPFPQRVVHFPSDTLKSKKSTSKTKQKKK